MEKPASRCFLCDKAGHRAADCWSRTKGNTSSRCGHQSYDHAHVKTEQCTDSGKGSFISGTQKVPGDLAAFQESSKGKKSSGFLHGNALEESPEPDKELEKAKKPQKGYYGKKEPVRLLLPLQASVDERRKVADRDSPDATVPPSGAFIKAHPGSLPAAPSSIADYTTASLLWGYVCSVTSSFTCCCLRLRMRHRQHQRNAATAVLEATKAAHSPYLSDSGQVSSTEPGGRIIVDSNKLDIYKEQGPSAERCGLGDCAIARITNHLAPAMQVGAF
ncbi:hypothetical protein HPB52_006833 [Rhipicephalus sanguineus]|uniref:CCHC-type domain-containing protein n=1 Tax=Rhipicephalus sanguineus TaxID=34632 RepID=A0A9D4PKF5_RHISA|nr:hypothetical protein HPB52_006833 [Rhipicephalus sanguineus]